MPLLKGKSKQAFSHNVGAEMEAGKPKAQALAIAYGMKRRNKAKGGMVANEKEDPSAEPMDVAGNPPAGLMTNRAIKHLAKGGMSPDHIASAVMQHRYAAGGEVNGATMAAQGKDPSQQSQVNSGAGALFNGMSDMGKNIGKAMKSSAPAAQQAMAEGGVVDYEDDFLSDEEDDSHHLMEMPDMDTDEEKKEKRKGFLSKIIGR